MKPRHKLAQIFLTNSQRSTVWVEVMEVLMKNHISFSRLSQLEDASVDNVVLTVRLGGIKLVVTTSLIHLHLSCSVASLLLKLGQSS